MLARDDRGWTRSHRAHTDVSALRRRAPLTLGNSQSYESLAVLLRRVAVVMRMMVSVPQPVE